MPPRSLIAILCALAAALPTGAAEPAPGADKAASKAKAAAKTSGGSKAVDAEDPASGSSSAMDNALRQIPLNVRNLDVRVPAFDKGRRTSRVVADAMTRISDHELRGEGVIIEIFGENPKDSIRAEMPTCIYDMQTKHLTSNERSKVTRADFILEGDAMDFDTVTMHTSMKGNVRLTLLDTSTIAPKPPAAPQPAPAAAAVNPSPIKQP